MAAHTSVSVASGDDPAAHPDREHDALSGGGELDHHGWDSSQNQRGRLSPAAEAQGTFILTLGRLSVFFGCLNV